MKDWLRVVVIGLGIFGSRHARDYADHYRDACDAIPGARCARHASVRSGKPVDVAQ
jgi:hypothetical protein